MADATAVWALPYPELDDEADISQVTQPLAERLEEIFNTLILGIQIGQRIYTDAQNDITVGSMELVLCDGRLIDKTTYAGYFAAVGHAFNGGVDPGGNKVRISDVRGRVLVGSDNMGTAQGAAGRLPNSNRARGQNGGAERKALATVEMPAHNHTGVTGGMNRNNPHTHASDASLNRNAGPDGARLLLGSSAAGDSPGIYAGIRSVDISHEHTISSQGNGQAFSLLQPYEVGNMLVRIK